MILLASLIGSVTAVLAPLRHGSLCGLSVSSLSVLAFALGNLFDVAVALAAPGRTEERTKPSQEHKNEDVYSSSDLSGARHGPGAVVKSKR